MLTSQQKKIKVGTSNHVYIYIYVYIIYIICEFHDFHMRSYHVHDFYPAFPSEKKTPLHQRFCIPPLQGPAFDRVPQRLCLSAPPSFATSLGDPGNSYYGHGDGVITGDFCGTWWENDGTMLGKWWQNLGHVWELCDFSSDSWWLMVIYGDKIVVNNC